MRVTSMTSAQPYKYVGSTFQYVVEIRCDAIADVTPPHSQWALGSIAYEVTTGDFYGLDLNNGTYSWVKQE